MSRDDAPVIVMLLALVAIVALFLVLLYFDAREFAAECIRAGGYVASPQTCVR